MGESTSGRAPENAELVKHISEVDRTAAEIRPLSLVGQPIERLLKLGIEAILSGHEWPDGTAAAALLTHPGNPPTLELVTAVGMLDEAKSKCGSVPFGTCLCGQVAQQQEMMLADENTPQAIESYFEGPHAHMIVPLVSAGETLGVINLVVPGRFVPRYVDKAYLQSMADVLSSVVKRERVLKELQENHSRLSAILEAFDGLMYMCTMDYQVEYANQQLIDLLGHDPVGQVCYQSIQGLDGVCPWCTNDRIAAGETVRSEVRLRLNDRYYMIVSRPIYHPDGTVSRVSMATDINDRRIAEQEVQRSLSQLSVVLDGVVSALAATTSSRDPYTASHQIRVARLACAIAEVMEKPVGFVEGLRTAALLHDIGKISIPSEILSKTRALDELEMGIIKNHSTVGHQLLEHVSFGHPVADAVFQHHERIDGSGYPQGLAGSDILCEARILGVADVVEAFCSHRPYRAALGVDAAIEEITKHAGGLYDAAVVAACVKVLETRPAILSEELAQLNVIV